MRNVIFHILPLVLLLGCANLEDASLAKRNTFIKFFSSAQDLTADYLEVTNDGYIITGTTTVSGTDYTVVIRTDKSGNQQDLQYIPGGKGKSIKPILNNGAVTGYVVIGDSIYTDPLAEQAANIEISSMKVLHLDPNFIEVKKYFKSDTQSGPSAVKIDYFAEAITITNSGRIIVLGSLKDGIAGQTFAPNKPFIIEFDGALDPVWSIEYDISGRTYQNSKTLIYQNGKIIWASALAIDQGGFNSSYVSIPVVAEQAAFINFSVEGQTTDQKFVPTDISPAYNTEFGFGVVGTYSKETNGSKGNLFFLRVSPSGDIIQGSGRYFDGSSGTSALTDREESTVLDAGESITSTRDGGFLLAGTTTLTSANKKDIWLLKVNAIGDAIWSKTFGGSGDEEPSSIRELPDGGFVICGTNTLGGFKSVFLMKTDKNGEINK